MKQKIDNLIIVLGAPNADDGTLSAIAESRCQKAVALYRELSLQNTCAVLPTGGMGEHFNRTEKAHADYTKQYMIKLGIAEDAFLEAALSHHTVEDAVLTHRILKKYLVKNCYIVTSDYHVDRVQYIFEYIFDFVYGSTSKLIMVSATAMISAEEKDRLTTHEAKALTGLKKNGVIYEGL